MDDWNDCISEMCTIAQQWDGMKHYMMQQWASQHPSGSLAVKIDAKHVPDDFYNKTVAFWLTLQEYGQSIDYCFSRQQLKRLDRLFCYYRDDIIYEIERKYRVPSRYMPHSERDFKLQDAFELSDDYGRPITSRGGYIQ